MFFWQNPNGFRPHRTALPKRARFNRLLDEARRQGIQTAATGRHQQCILWVWGGSGLFNNWILFYGYYVTASGLFNNWVI